MFDRSTFLDSNGRPITQSLFLECGYSDAAVYTLKDQDHSLNGKTYISMKRLYLEMEDVNEYEFATTYLLGWRHWLRLYENKQLRNHITEWREELEYKLRSRASKQMIDMAAQGNYQATKWLNDRGWAIRGAGRPSKAEKDGQQAIENRIANEYGADVVRMFQKV